jgi:hypothetical protein
MSIVSIVILTRNGLDILLDSSCERRNVTSYELAFEAIGSQAQSIFMIEVEK